MQITWEKKQQKANIAENINEDIVKKSNLQTIHGIVFDHIWRLEAGLAQVSSLI